MLLASEKLVSFAAINACGPPPNRDCRDRGDTSSESDVDLMAEFDPEKRFSLLDMVRLENRLR